MTDKRYPVSSFDSSNRREITATDKLLVDRGDGTFAERVEAYPPVKLMTDSDGDYARVRVDVGQTGFFAGREFCIFHEFTLGAGASIVYEFDFSLVEVIVQRINCQLWDGDARFEILSDGGTVGGTFGTTLSQVRTNRMTTADLAYASKAIVKTGGTYTGGISTEVTELDTGVGSGHQHESIGDISPYGVAKGKYYMKIIAGFASRGAINIRWEERL